MTKRTGKPRGRPRTRVMPPDIDATPEELARTLFPAPPSRVAVAVEPQEPEEEPEGKGGR